METELDARAGRRPPDQCRDRRGADRPGGGGARRRGGRRDRGDRAGPGRERGRPPQPARAAWRCPTAATRWSAARPTRRRACARPSRRRARRLPGGCGEVEGGQDPRRSSRRGCCARRRSWASATITAGSCCCPRTRRSAPISSRYLGLDDWILDDRDHAEPARRALGGRGGPRGRRAHRRPVPLPQGAGHRGRAGGLRARRAGHPGARPLPALLRARDHRAHREAVAAVAGPAPARGGPAAHQQPGGRDQLHHVGDGPAAPRLRPRHARPSTRWWCAARGPASASRRWTARSARSGPTPRWSAIPSARSAIGGVMGGADSEVTASTTSVLLEAAYWDPGSIRRTSRALGLSTDAAYRFERGGDIEAPPDVLARAAQLMADLGGGTVARGVLDVYPDPRPHRRIALRLERVDAGHRRVPAARGRRPDPPGAGLRGGRLGRRPAGGGAELPARRAPGGRSGRGDRPHLGLRPDPADAGGRRRDRAGQAPGRACGWRA